jgi:hypothetical protein
VSQSRPSSPKRTRPAAATQVSGLRADPTWMQPPRQEGAGCAVGYPRQPLASSPGCSLGISTHPTYLGSRRAELRFTVHRPPRGEVSLCWDRPSGGNVSRRLRVGAARAGRAGHTRNDRLALAVFGCDAPTASNTDHAVLGADLGQLRTLLVIPWGVTSGLPQLLPLDSQVGCKPGVAATLHQHHLPIGCWQQSEPRHTRTLATTTDTNEGRPTARVGVGVSSSYHYRGLPAKEGR